MIMEFWTISQTLILALEIYSGCDPAISLSGFFQFMQRVYSYPKTFAVA